MKSQLDDLLNFCSRNDRVCPHPPHWERLWGIIGAHKQAHVRWHPPRPMILSQWWDTSAGEKRVCLEKHLRWASEHGILEKVDNFIRNLSEEQWYHSKNRPPATHAKSRPPQPAGG